jgi:hypothetical protein
MHLPPTVLSRSSERNAPNPMPRLKLTMLIVCTRCSTMIITAFKEHPAPSIAAGKLRLAATPMRNSRIRHSLHIDAHRRPLSPRHLESGLQNRSIGKVSGESQMEPCERRVCTSQCGFRREALGDSEYRISDCVNITTYRQLGAALFC